MKNDSIVIELDHLVRTFGNTDAVNGLTLTVPAGCCYGFFGRNGAGKTTTIKCLLNLLQPTHGRVRLFGLDPIVRREFIETGIGAYQEGDPQRRTLFVSTHLISEFEGLIDQFTIIDNGREILTMDSDQARLRFQKIRAAFPQIPADLDKLGAQKWRKDGRDLELLVNGNSPAVLDRLKTLNPQSIHTESLSLEEIFLATLK